jgi:ribosomal protein S16
VGVLMRTREGQRRKEEEHGKRRKGLEVVGTWQEKEREREKRVEVEEMKEWRGEFRRSWLCLERCFLLSRWSGRERKGTAIPPMGHFSPRERRRN